MILFVEETDAQINAETDVEAEVGSWIATDEFQINAELEVDVELENLSAFTITSESTTP